MREERKIRREEPEEGAGSEQTPEHNNHRVTKAIRAEVKDTQWSRIAWPRAPYLSKRSDASNRPAKRCHKHIMAPNEVRSRAFTERSPVAERHKR